MCWLVFVLALGIQAKELPLPFPINVPVTRSTGFRELTVMQVRAVDKLTGEWGTDTPKQGYYYLVFTIKEVNISKVPIGGSWSRDYSLRLITPEGLYSDPEHGSWVWNVEGFDYWDTEMSPGVSDVGEVVFEVWKGLNFCRMELTFSKGPPEPSVIFEWEAARTVGKGVSQSWGQIKAGIR
ncbi:MAG: hypothetical protein DRP11_05335 [Candidatus Aenigmatarchaeota archaeon]|nr:MAG: hypothetical protein DRP11_05335 [Candidatus Aenigmarchaeota archaeon]